MRLWLTGPPPSDALRRALAEIDFVEVDGGYALIQGKRLKATRFKKIVLALMKEGIQCSAT